MLLQRAITSLIYLPPATIPTSQHTVNRPSSLSSTTRNAFRARPSPSGESCVSTYDVPDRKRSFSNRWQTSWRSDGPVAAAAGTGTAMPRPLGGGGGRDEARLKGTFIASSAHERAVIRDLSPRAILASSNGRREKRNNIRYNVEQYTVIYDENNPLHTPDAVVSVHSELATYAVTEDGVDPYPEPFLCVCSINREIRRLWVHGFGYG